ncbi:hypothetical protein [cf. Phormidesmis sp. LEGE 11477]|nr:hypothetical protein [cf. Phormidesmis sp. LEGE 11477]
MRVAIASQYWCFGAMILASVSQPAALGTLVVTVPTIELGS